jgi:hypothetical protein
MLYFLEILNVKSCSLISEFSLFRGDPDRERGAFESFLDHFTLFPTLRESTVYSPIIAFKNVHELRCATVPWEGNTQLGNLTL